MLLWKEARDRENRDLAHAATFAHAAVATAIVNTIAGKEVPEFAESIRNLLGENGSHAPSGPPLAHRDDALTRLGFERTADASAIDNMEEF